MSNKNRGELLPDEYHPAAGNALAKIKSLSIVELMQWMESFTSMAIEGNRLSEICGETLRRIIEGEPVSDRYVLGLSFTMFIE